MKTLKHERKGQMVTSEYVLLFFVVIAAISAMSLYVQRGMQARQRDARKYMMNLASTACTTASVNGVDCMAATVNTANGATALAQEYEPYYLDSSSDIRRDSADKRMLDAASTAGKSYATSTVIKTDSNQSPPKEGSKNVYNN